MKSIETHDTIRIVRLRPIVFIFVFLLGAVLRLVGLDAQPLFIDEAYSVWFAKTDWGYLWNEVPQFESHPPLYYSILKAWMSLGQDEGTLRLLSALVSIATMPLVFLLGRLVAGDQYGFKVGIVSMLIFAVNSGQIDRAQDARSYAFWIFAMALSVAGLAWLVRNPEAARLPPSRWLKIPAAVGAFGAFSIGISLLPWFHNVGLVYVASIACFCGLWWVFYLRLNRVALLNLAIVGFIFLVFYSPYFPLFLSQTSDVIGKFGAPLPGPLDIVKFMAQVIGYWDYTVLRLRYVVGFNAFLLVMAGLGLVKLWRRQDRAFVLLLCIVFLMPPVLILLASFTIQPIFLSRLLLPVFIPWAVMMAASVMMFSRYLWGGLVVIGVIAVYSSALPTYYETVPVRGMPWDRIAKTIVDRTAGPGIVLTSPNSLALALDYYLDRYDTQLKLIPLPVAYPSRDPSYPYPWGHAAAGIDQRAVDTMNRAIADAGMVSLVRWNQRVFDPDNLLIENLSAQFCLRRYSYGGGSVEVFELTRRRESETASCIEDRIIEDPICPRPLTRLARSSFGCIGPEANVSKCYGHGVKCRLELK